MTKIQNINEFPLTAHGRSSCANWSLMVQIEGGSSDVNSFCCNLHPRGDSADHVSRNMKKMTEFSGSEQIIHRRPITVDGFQWKTSRII